jgi:purine catabolism regulator
VVRDLRSITSTLGGTLLEGGTADRADQRGVDRGVDRVNPGVMRSPSANSPVDTVLRLDEFAVVGHPDYATLVVGSGPELADALADPRRVTALRGAALVTADDTVRLRAAIARTGATAIIGVQRPAAALHPLLVALLATDQAAEDRLVTTGTKVLTQVARRGGVRAVIAELAHRIDGWAVLIDPHGQLITTAGAGGLHVQDAVAVAFNRPVRVRHPGLQVHPVGPGEDLSAYLVISSREGSRSRSRDLASQTAALLDLLLRTHDHTNTERLGRELMVGTLLAGGSAATALLRRWGVRDAELAAFAVAARSKSVDVERLVLRWLDDLGAVHVVAEEAGRLIGFVRAEHGDALARLVVELSAVAAGGSGSPGIAGTAGQATATGRAGAPGTARPATGPTETRVALHLGLGSPAATDALARSADEARQALETAMADGRDVVRYRALPTVAYVFDRLGEADASRLVTILDPLLGADGAHGELTRTLRVYLAEHGTWGVAAERLGVHRQTLASRIRRVEELTGLSMGDPDDRTAAWLALRALDR